MCGESVWASGREGRPPTAILSSTSKVVNPNGKFDTTTIVVVRKWHIARARNCRGSLYMSRDVIKQLATVLVKGAFIIQYAYML